MKLRRRNFLHLAAGAAADLGVEPISPAAFTKFIGTESDNWTKVIKAAGVTLD